MEEEHPAGEFENEQQINERTPGDRFNEFMFGPRKPQNLSTEHQQPFNHQPEHERNMPQAYIDYEQLMISFDSLMESIQNLKPLFLQFKPIMQQIWKKK